ncbi:MAG TPA: hypothetical protein VM901_00280 [Bdellovibrionota bacterium]|jgi:hypothetical protein|nr:hypothetical protein [Bdellovibrionota bacterium]
MIQHNKDVSKIRLAHSILASTFLFVLGACSQQYDLGVVSLPDPKVSEHETPRSLKDYRESFTVTPATASQIDILFVIDNSASMGEEQDNLAASFDGFINTFQTKGLDFHLGVVSTDTIFPSGASSADLGSRAWTSGAYTGINNRGPGSLLSRDADKYLSHDSPNLTERFKNNVKLGESGSPYETGVLAAIYALDPSLLSAGEWNEGFVRSQAFLSIIFLSDEDESSVSSDVNYNYIVNDPTSATQRKNEFFNRVLSLKNSKRGMIRVDAIVKPSAESCSHARQAGIFYSQMASAFGGRISNICNDFSADLASIGDQISSDVQSTFALNKSADSKLVITLNGTTLVVGRDYQYQINSKSVKLLGSALTFVKSNPSTIVVNYSSYE